jgi:hypothetical protein
VRLNHHFVAGSKVKVALLFATALAVIWLAKMTPKSSPADLLKDPQAMVSLDRAVGAVHCGDARPHTSGQIFAISAERLGAIRARDLPGDTLGSLEAYCASLPHHVMSADNSLVLLEAAVLALMPRATIQDLARALVWTKVTCFFIFGLALLRIGTPWPIALAAILFGVGVLREANPGFSYSIYPFLAPLLAVYIASAILAVRAENFRFLAWMALGALAVFVSGMRTSHAPIALGIFVLCLCLLGNRRKIAVALTGFAVGLLACLSAYQFLLVDPEVKYLTRHPVGHPLVLALAIPPNRLAEREGITWNDSVGVEIARRVDSKATYLTHEYDKALMSYYFALWRKHPYEMAAIYWSKLKLAGVSAKAWAGARGGMFRLLWPLHLVVNGAVLAGLYAAGLALAIFWRRSALWSLLCLSALMLLAEQAAVYPAFVMSYANPLLFVMGVTVILIAWTGVSAFQVAVQRRRRRREGGGFIP